MSYRLLALDLDGTTVDTGRPPSRRLLDALAAAQERGVHVVLASGRAYESMCEYAEALGVRGPLVTVQGAIVREQHNGRNPLLVDYLPHEPLFEFITLAGDLDLELTLYTECEVYATRVRHDREFYDLWFGPPVVQVNDLAATARDLIASGVPLIKALAISERLPGRQPLEALLEARFAGRLSVVRSHKLFVEVLSPTASKGRAVSFLAERWGIPRAETIAVGDSGNDISMIRWAGLGVAMGNASPDALAAADWVAPRVTEDGVAVVIEKFLLDEA